MKRIAALVLALALMLPALARAQWPGPQGGMMFSSNCANSPQFGLAPLCFDTTVNGVYVWSGTAFVGASRNIWAGGENAVNSTSVADFAPIQGVGTPAASAAEGNALQQITQATKVKNLKCQFVVAGGTVTACGGTSYVVAVRKNQSDSALTCTCGATGTSCSDTTDVISFAANDLIDIGVTPSGTPTALEAKCTVEADF